MVKIVMAYNLRGRVLKYIDRLPIELLGEPVRCIQFNRYQHMVSLSEQSNLQLQHIDEKKFKQKQNNNYDTGKFQSVLFPSDEAPLRRSQVTPAGENGRPAAAAASAAWLGESPAPVGGRLSAVEGHTSQKE